MQTVKRSTVETLQNRQLLLSVRLVNAAYAEESNLTSFQKFDALELAYQFGLWNARQFRKAREILSRA